TEGHGPCRALDFALGGRRGARQGKRGGGELAAVKGPLEFLRPTGRGARSGVNVCFLSRRMRWATEGAFSRERARRSLRLPSYNRPRQESSPTPLPRELA